MTFEKMFHYITVAGLMFRGLGTGNNDFVFQSFWSFMVRRPVWTE
jgi:hypothetical protein